MFFGENEIKSSFTNSLGRSSQFGSPFLDFASDGAFIGGGFQLRDETSFSGVYFKGSQEEQEFLVIDMPSSSGLLLEYKESFHQSSFSLQAGLLEEPESFLGGSLKGGYGSIDKTLTFFSGIQASHIFSRFYTTGSIFYGETDIGLSETGLINSLDKFSSSSFNLGIFTKGILKSHDSFGFKVTQPLRLEEAEVELSIPVGRTKYREVLFEEYQLGLSPSGREIKAEFIYQKPLSNGSFFTSFGYIKDHGHLSSKKAEPFLAANWQFYLF
jgi:hypothetical protein